MDEAQDKLRRLQREIEDNARERLGICDGLVAATPEAQAALDRVRDRARALSEGNGG